MTIAQRLSDALSSGLNQIGQVAILENLPQARFALCHLDDRGDATSPSHNLTPLTDPFALRDWNTLGNDGEFRFLKAAPNLKSGWLFLTQSPDSLREALDVLYPAALSLWLAEQDDTLRVQNLRPKLKRQTGMYRFAHTISDEGAQKLVAKECHPDNCARRILWDIDTDLALSESETSQWSGKTAESAIPLLCQEACNHLVSECRKGAKAEADAAKNG